MFDWCKIKISVFVNNSQLPVTGLTALTQSNLHDFNLESKTKQGDQEYEQKKHNN